MQVAPQLRPNSSLSGKVPTAQPSSLNSLFNKTIHAALRYTVKPIANCVAQGAAIAIENSALWYMRQNEQVLTQFTGSPDLVEFIHAFSREYPIFEGKEALQAQFFIHMLATFAKKEKSNWTGAELLLRFVEWFTESYKVINESKSYSPAEFSDMASQVLGEIMPELNYCDFFGYFTSKMGTIFAQLHDAHLAACVTSPKKVNIQEWLPSKPSNETIVCLLSGALPSASADFIEELVSVFMAPNQMVLNPFKDFFESTKDRLLTHIFEKIEKRDYAFLRPFALSTIEVWPDLLKASAIDFIQEEKSIPLFLKGPLIHYIDQNASLLALESYRMQTVRAKRILSEIWPVIVKNPLLEDGHEVAARNLIKPIIDFLIPEEAIRSAVMELALLEMGCAYSHSGQKNFALFLSSYKETIFVQVTNLYNKRGGTLGDMKKLLNQIAPSFTILFPKGIKVAHDHLVRLIQFTRPLTKQDKINLVEKSLGDRQKAVTRVNDLSFLLDFGISYLQEKSFTSHNVVAGTTAEPFFAALKEGILRLFLQASAHVDLPCALSLLEDISELIKRKKIGESVGHIIAAKIRALSPDFDPEEIEWLVTSSWPFIKDEAQFLIDLFKGTGIAQFTGAASLFSKMVDKVQGLLVDSMGSLVTGSHFVSALERTASLTKPFVEAILKRLLLNLIERGQKKDPQSTSAFLLLVLGFASVVEESNGSIEKFALLLCGPLPKSMEKLLVSKIRSLVAAINLWADRKKEYQTAIDKLFKPKVFTGFVHDLSNNWIVAFIPHFLKNESKMLATKVGKLLQLTDTSGLERAFLQAATLLKRGPMNQLLLTFGNFSEAAILQLFYHLFAFIEKEDTAKKNQGGFLFEMMTEGVEKLGLFYQTVFSARVDFFGYASDSRIALALSQTKQIHIPKADDYEGVSNKIASIAIPQEMGQFAIPFLGTILLPIVLKAIEDKLMARDTLDGFLKILVEKLQEIVKNKSPSSLQTQAVVNVPIPMKGKFGRLARNLLHLVPSIALAPLLEMEEISKMTDDQLDQLFFALFHQTNFFTFITPLIEAITPSMKSPDFTTAVDQSQDVRRKEIQKGGASLLIRGTEKMIDEKTALIWSSLKCFFNRIWDAIAFAIGDFLAQALNSVSRRVESSRYAEPIRQVGHAIWTFFDFLFSDIILGALKTVAFVPYWIFKELMTLYLERKLGAYIDELHRPHHRGAFFHFLSAAVETFPAVPVQA